MLVTIISSVFCLVSTSVGIISIPSCTKCDSGITDAAIVFVAANDTDSCLGEPFMLYIEPLLGYNWVVKKPMSQEVSSMRYDQVRWDGIYGLETVVSVLFTNTRTRWLHNEREIFNTARGVAECSIENFEFGNRKSGILISVHS